MTGTSRQNHSVERRRRMEKEMIELYCVKTAKRRREEFMGNVTAMEDANIKTAECHRTHGTSMEHDRKSEEFMEREKKREKKKGKAIECDRRQRIH